MVGWSNSWCHKLWASIIYDASVIKAKNFFTNVKYDPNDAGQVPAPEVGTWNIDRDESNHAVFSKCVRGERFIFNRTQLKLNQDFKII